MAEDLEFRLYQKGIELIQKEIIECPVAVRLWPGYIHSFVTNICSRQKLRDDYKNGQFAEVIMKTLEEWLEEQNSKATLAALVQLLSKHALNSLCDSLVAKAQEINKVQLQSCNIPVIKNTHIRNFWFGMTDVPNFVGRVEDLKTLHKLVTENLTEEHNSLALLTSIHGFGGIGKTTLARMYAWKYRTYFDGNVVWIDSERFGAMRMAFQKIAKELHLEVDNTIPDLIDLIKSVYNAFGDSKCLFIFDNAEEFNGQDGVAQFLPSGIIRKPYLLLTSRRKDCFQTKRILPLNVLSESDSIKLIQDYIPGATDEIAVQLANRLDRVPLAIHQAIAYVKKSLPLFSVSLETDVSKSINSFLKEYEGNSNTIVDTQFIGADGYTKNISSICKMSLQKMEDEEGGNLAKHMLTYISFLHPDHIELDFVLNLAYQTTSTKDIDMLGNVMDPNRTTHLLYSYSLIDINVNGRAIKVHRLVQDAMRLMLPENQELLYVEPLLSCLVKEEYEKRLLHLVSIRRSCRSEGSKSYFEEEVPETVIEFMELVISAGLNIDVSNKLVKIGDFHEFYLITPILKAMKCNDINESAETFLKIYFKVGSELEGRKEASFALTNYVVFANYIIPEQLKNVSQVVFECLLILKIREFAPTLLLELLGTNYPMEDVNNFLDLVKRCRIAAMSSVKFEIDYIFYMDLFDEHLQIPESLLNDFPCLKYLKPSLSFTNVDELQALNLSWVTKNSIVWSLFFTLEFNLDAIRSAIDCISETTGTIAEYLQHCKNHDVQMQQHKKLEIIVPVVNANLLRAYKPLFYALLTLICCLPSQFNVLYNFEYVFNGLDANQYELFSLEYLLKLGKWQFVSKKGAEDYFMNSEVKVALRKYVLSLEDKSQSVKHLHKSRVASRKTKFYDEMVKYWRYVMDQEDLREIALNNNLYFPD